MTESEMLALCDKFMESMRFHIDKNSQDRKTRKQLSGRPDREYMGHDLFIYVEGKVNGNDLTDAERAWWLKMQTYLCGDHVHGWIVRSVDELKARVDEVLQR